MSLAENAAHIRRGYEDQRDGKVDPVLAEADTTQGQLYRTGIRERRREEEDSKSAPAMCSECAPEFACWLAPVGCIKWRPPGTAPDNGTPIELRLDEKTIVTGKREDDQWYAAGRMQGSPTAAIWHKILAPIGWRLLKFERDEVVEEAPPDLSPVQPGAPFETILRAGPFTDVQPGSRKPRKAKPVDDAQASLF